MERRCHCNVVNCHVCDCVDVCNDRSATSTVNVSISQQNRTQTLGVITTETGPQLRPRYVVS